MNPRNFTPSSITLNTEQLDQYDVDQLHDLLQNDPAFKKLGVHTQYVLSDLITSYYEALSETIAEEPTEIGTIIVCKEKESGTFTYMLTSDGRGLCEWVNSANQKKERWSIIATHFDSIEIVYSPIGKTGMVDITPPNDVATLNERASEASVSRGNSWNAAEFSQSVTDASLYSPVLVEAEMHGNKMLYTDAIEIEKTKVETHSVKNGRVYYVKRNSNDSYKGCPWTDAVIVKKI